MWWQGDIKLSEGIIGQPQVDDDNDDDDDDDDDVDDDVDDDEDGDDDDDDDDGIACDDRVTSNYQRVSLDMDNLKRALQIIGWSAYRTGFAKLD